MATPRSDTYLGTPGEILYVGMSTPVAGDADEPTQLRLYDWSNPSSPTLAASMTFDTDLADMVFEDSRLNSEIGAVKVKQSTQSMILNGFEFGATRYRIRPELNDVDNTKPVWQVVVAFKPYARWSSYPAYDTYVKATDSTFPTPFKIQILNSAGTVLHTYEMRDGLAINSADLSHSTRTITKPLRPHITVAQQLPWQSARIKYSTYMNYWYAGVTADSRHARDARVHYSTNAAIPLIAERFQINSMLHWYRAPKWPIRFDNVYGGATDTNAMDPNLDSNMNIPATIYTGENETDKVWRAVGWGYEPGSISCHDWYPGPGGSRFDRAFIPSVFALFASTPTGTRATNNDSLREMAEAWSMAYFNHPYYYTTNVKTFAGINDAQILARQWSYGGAYYGTGFNYVSGGNTRHVATFGIPNADGWPASSPDKDGKRQFNGAQFDDQHGYSAPAWSVLLLNSPMHVNAAKQRFASQTMAWLGDTISSVANFYGRRAQSWRWLHYSTMWIVGTGSHPLGHSRANIEAMFAQELEAIHDNLYVPAIVNNSTNFTMKTLRELGIYHEQNTASGGGQTWYPILTPLWGYIGGPLMLMKQSGMWAAMRARNSKCSLALDFVVECLDKWSIDWIVGTNGRAEYSDEEDNTNDNALSTKASSIGGVTMPTSWANWATLHPPVGSESWIRASNGALKERYAAQHLHAQWAFIRRDYFADHNPGRANINEACTLYTNFYAEYRASSGTSSWNYRIPAHGIILPQP